MISEATHTKEKITTGSTNPVIKITGLYKSFGENNAILKGVDLIVNKGENLKDKIRQEKNKQQDAGIFREPDYTQIADAWADVRLVSIFWFEDPQDQWPENNHPQAGAGMYAGRDIKKIDNKSDGKCNEDDEELRNFHRQCQNSYRINDYENIILIGTDKINFFEYQHLNDDV